MPNRTKSPPCRSCQRAIARQVVDRGGDYGLALKGNQGSLLDDVRLFLDDPAQEATACEPVVDADHGRIETRTAMLSTAIGKVTRVRETAAKTTTETAYYTNRP